MANLSNIAGYDITKSPFAPNLIIGSGDGGDGVVYVPHITRNEEDTGWILSWTNDGELENPDDVTIYDGTNGTDGTNGFTFTPHITEIEGGYELSWTNDGEQENPQTIQIMQGSEGDGFYMRYTGGDGNIVQADRLILTKSANGISILYPQTQTESGGWSGELYRFLTNPINVEDQTAEEYFYLQSVQKVNSTFVLSGKDDAGNEHSLVVTGGGGGGATPEVYWTSEGLQIGGDLDQLNIVDNIVTIIARNSEGEYPTTDIGILPESGSASQVLVKNSSDAFDAAWADLPFAVVKNGNTGLFSITKKENGADVTRSVVGLGNTVKNTHRIDAIISSDGQYSEDTSDTIETLTPTSLKFTNGYTRRTFTINGQMQSDVTEEQNRYLEIGNEGEETTKSIALPIIYHQSTNTTEQGPDVVRIGVRTWSSPYQLDIYDRTGGYIPIVSGPTLQDISINSMYMQNPITLTSMGTTYETSFRELFPYLIGSDEQWWQLLSNEIQGRDALMIMDFEIAVTQTAPVTPSVSDSGGGTIDVALKDLNGSDIYSGTGHTASTTLRFMYSGYDIIQTANDTEAQIRCKCRGIIHFMTYADILNTAKLVFTLQALPGTSHYLQDYSSIRLVESSCLIGGFRGCAQ